MKKGSKKTQKVEAQVVAETPIVETAVAVAEPIVEVVAEPIVEKRAPGRPVNPTSVRQARLAEQQARVVANGGVTLLGRPKNPESARQKQINERLARIAAGEVIKRGRPKFVKEEIVVEVKVDAPTEQ